MALISVDEALERVLAGIRRLPAEKTPLHEAAGRVLAAKLSALRTQPPFDVSAMDGYAVQAADIATVPAILSVIGEAAAGRRFSGRVRPGEAVRIFTGAPVPEGADTILIQENARPMEAGRIEAITSVVLGRHIRSAGTDFHNGDILLDDGRVLDPAALSLMAAAGHSHLPVVGRPLVAIIATGDELVPPGIEPGADQIVASNSYGVAALAKQDGANILDLGIVPDRHESISDAVRAALAASADIIVTLGGVSVGDHDLVQDVLQAEGMELAFWKIAMRPGKPLMFGKLNSARVLGLPGNPVSSLVCAHLFLRPMVARLSGRLYAPDIRSATLARPMKANGERRDYVRATVVQQQNDLLATPFDVQDSSMLTTLAAANALILREPQAPAADAGARCQVLMLR
ncbi:gephyrin-like molybdotransferase Glp [Chelativorans sp. Marseille-P2723]|uniref:molybdopterin molybdotransferase MoeA n=1 Tax=Chelativorans sp. Marseille-P2723 TaxID=2709133 RepID=UPI00156F3D26|nr:gephyrin-like molybdotransferase Glp [Chelativorans sp. Marseille-P2723]